MVRNHLALGVMLLYEDVLAEATRPAAGKEAKREARLLGEKLEGSIRTQSVSRRKRGATGELRSHTPSYIALLVELGERKVISLAQHKTTEIIWGDARASSLRKRETTDGQFSTPLDGWPKLTKGLQGALLSLINVHKVTGCVGRSDRGRDERGFMGQKEN